MENKNEIWKDIPNYEGLYQVSNYGRVKKIRFRNNKYNLEREKIITNKFANKYCFVKLVDNNGNSKQYYVHILVAKSFLNKQNFKSMPSEDKNLINLDNLEINHKDENKCNNFVNNLEWCTHKYNMNYNSLHKKISKKISKRVKQISKQNVVIKIWDSIVEAQNELHINNISKCCQNKNNCKTAGGYIWRYVNE